MPDVPTFSLTGKTIVQFGGSGLLGPALISALSSAGADLIVVSRSRRSIEPILTREQATGRSFDIDEADPRSESSVQQLRDRLLGRHARIDGVVYNSASRPMRSMDDDLSAWEDSMQTNATGLFATVRVFGNVLAAQRSGSMVMIASMQGVVGMNPSLYEGTNLGAAPDYFFHKGGMINLTRYLASHYGQRGVRVNAVSPGGIYNPANPQSPLFLERYEKATMLGRMADAAEIGGPVVFLLSDAAGYITGANLIVDGGYTAK